MAYIFQECDFTVDFSEMSGSPKESITRDGFKVQRQLKCAWTDRKQLAMELMGYVEVKSGDVITHKPHIYEYYHDWLVCLQVDPEPFSDPIENPSDTRVAEYEFAVLNANYAIPEYEKPFSGAETYISESIEPASEFITMPNEGLVWESDARPVEASEAPSKIIRMTQWRYTLHKAIAVPSFVLTLPGSVNSAPVTSRSLDLTYPTGTLLCGNPEADREITSAGVGTWRVSFRFLYRNNGTLASPKGWNYLPRLNKAVNDITFERMYYGGYAKNIYPFADFTGLIL